MEPSLRGACRPLSNDSALWLVERSLAGSGVLGAISDLASAIANDAVRRSAKTGPTKPDTICICILQCAPHKKSIQPPVVAVVTDISYGVHSS